MTSKQKPKKYKLKTHKATVKRFKMTGSGRLMRTTGPKSHLRRKKSDRTKRTFLRMTEVKGSGEMRRVRRLAPYISRYSSMSSRRGGGSKK